MKLIRDKYADIIPEDKLDLSTKTDDQKLELITEKLKEEAIEFLESKQRNPIELADLMQVIVDWGEMNGFSFDTINKLRKDKLKEKGGFSNFIVLKEEDDIQG